MLLYRPVNQAELDLIKDLNWRAFPPRLPEQPIFYPVLNSKYAEEISKEWNVPTYKVGYVLEFEVADEFIEKYEVQKAGLDYHLEYWIPAEDLTEFNRNIIGEIKVIRTYR